MKKEISAKIKNEVDFLINYNINFEVGYENYSSNNTFGHGSPMSRQKYKTKKNNNTDPDGNRSV